MRFRLEDAPPVSTPMEVGTQLVPADDDASAELHVPYKEIIGSLMYAATATRPDIVFAVSALAQFVH